MYPIKMPVFDFRNKSVIITGAGNGIGRAAAMEFAHYGASVGVVDVDLERAERVVNVIKENEGRAIAIKADISSSESVEQMISAVKSAFGGIDILIANAGIGGATLPLLEQPIEEFDKVISVNLRGAYLCCTAAARQMIEQGKGGRIVLTSSIAAIEGGGNHGGHT